MKQMRLPLLIMLLGILAFPVLSCSRAQETASDTSQPAPSSEQPVSPPDGTMPAPPQGSVPGDRPSASALDLAAAAAKLGVTEQQLSDALGDTGQGPLDLATAAQKLGVSEESLREALGMPEGGPPPGGSPPSGVELNPVTQ